MVRSNIRLAAGVGVVAASLLTFGPVSTPAVADDRGSGSHSSRDDRGRWDRGGKGDRLDRNPTLADDGPLMRVGTARTDQEGLRAPENLTIAERAAADQPGVVEEPGPSARSGSDHGGAPAVSVRTPRVKIGNGRPPVVRHRDFDPPVEMPVAPEVAPPAPERVVIDLPQPPRIDRGQPPRLVPKLGAARSTSTSDPLFGLAGLLLIPAVGAALGYRQARAAQNAARSGRP
ncbi:MAG: hypothetical protein ACRDU5_01105 [Mycobacterium sp.]